MNSVAPSEREPGSGPRPLDDKPPESGEIEKAPASQRGDFGFTGLHELQRLEKDAAEARALADAEPGNEKLQKRAETREWRVEIFGLEHDRAGAAKFDRFGRDVVKMFEAGANGQGGIVIDAETGRLSLAESEEGRRFLFVNMGELDRVNKEGGHAGGDLALQEAVRAIESSLLSTMGEGMSKVEISMVRFSGNDYMLNLRGVDDAQAAQIGELVRNYWSNMDAGSRDEKLAELGIDEPMPFSVTGFEMQEALNIMSDAQLELSKGERISSQDPATAARDFIDTLNLHANYLLDMTKFKDRTERMRQKLDDEAEANRRAPADGADESRDPIGKSRAFFDTYLKKMFDGPLADARAFASLPPEVIDRLAQQYATKSLEGAQTAEKTREAIVDRRVKEIRASRTGKSGEYPRIQPPGEVQLAVIPERTEGQKINEAVNVAALDEMQSGDPDDQEHAAARRDKELRKRDAGTGLFTRNMYYAEAQRGFAEGKKQSMVFFDMAFLKYFDKSGGTEVGNNALKYAAHLLERALEENGIEGKAYRYAGDEFTVLLDGDVAAADEFRAMVDKLVNEAGAIPAGALGTREGYQPTKIAFNGGTADSAMAEAVYADLVAAGVYNERDQSEAWRVNNEKANLMTIIADKGIERPKAVDRFLMLVDGKNDAQYGTDPAYKQQVDGLQRWSGKAIFSEKGGVEFLEAVTAEAKANGGAESVRAKVEAWVDQRLAEVPEAKNRKSELTTKLVELHGQMRYFEARLHEARQKEVVTSMDLQRLVDEKARLQKERDALISVRNVLRE